MKGRYVRTSSSTQSNARQIQKQHPKEKIYIDVISGAIAFKEYADPQNSDNISRLI